MDDNNLPDNEETQNEVNEDGRNRRRFGGGRAEKRTCRTAWNAWAANRPR